MARLIKIWEPFYYSFPIQLFLNNFKRNQVLLLCWIILFAMITGSMTAGFTTAFNITCYIADGHRFSFVGALPRPFAKFCLNNGILPFIFLITYIFQVIRFQFNNEYSTPAQIFWNLA